jgi:hypothetical protein
MNKKIVYSIANNIIILLLDINKIFHRVESHQSKLHCKNYNEIKPQRPEWPLDNTNAKGNDCNLQQYSI